MGCVASAAVAVSRGGGVSARVCVCLPGGCLPGGGGVSAQGGCVHLPRVDRMRDAYENITFPQLLLRTVKRLV